MTMICLQKVASTQRLADVNAQAHVVTIGAFDGVHLGHQQLLQQCRERALVMNLPSVVVLFEPQPNEYFQREQAPARLSRLREKVGSIAAAGIDKILCLKFDANLRSLSAEQFVQQVLVDKLHCKHLIVGDDFRFGCDRNGDFDFLVECGQQAGFDVSDTSTFESGQQRISSTRIRALLAAGQLDQAAALLGRPYSNCARVCYGQQLGRTLGFPTANLALGRLNVALQGVFAVQMVHQGVRYDAVANVGSRPTVDGKSKPRLEVHVLDQHLDLYGHFVEVCYLSKLRDEKKFADLASLQQQIQRDADEARQFFKQRLAVSRVDKFIVETKDQ